MKKNILCKFFGCAWRFNSRMPDKCICKRCGIKNKLDLSNFEWIKIDSFGDGYPEDNELKNNWLKLN